MPILNTAKALRSLRKTPTILNRLLEDISQDEARTLRDGDDGWSILYVVCHLSDYEQIFYTRAQLMLETHHPTFLITPNEILIQQNKYDMQDVHEAYDTYLKRRRDFIQLLENLTGEAWMKSGIHPDTGDTTILTLAINTALHDINHIGQIVQILDVPQ